jgi:protein farnesyltransferase subunit beta
VRCSNKSYSQYRILILPRGAYCASVIISLLDLPLTLPSDSPGRKTETGTFFTGLPEWIGRCQTYEGGMSAFPGVEAHGAYAFCALACLSILGEPHVMIPKYLDIQALVSWLSARQYAPEGGFCGRTNKLVDGCYSFWVGGCWPLIAAALNPPGSTVDSPACLYDKEGLIRYILCACQDTSKRGGLRDKPSKNSDPYHTCYVLAGLSSAQHVQHLVPGSSETAEGAIPVAPKAAFRWFVDVSGDEAVKDLYEEDDKVGALHPVFVLPPGVAELMREYFEGKEGF